MPVKLSSTKDSIDTNVIRIESGDYRMDWRRVGLVASKNGHVMKKIRSRPTEKYECTQCGVVSTHTTGYETLVGAALFEPCSGA